MEKMQAARKTTHRNDRLLKSHVFTDHRGVGVLAEHWGVIVDVCDVDVHRRHVTQWGRAPIRGFHGEVIFVGALIIQVLNDEYGPCMERQNYFRHSAIPGFSYYNITTLKHA